MEPKGVDAAKSHETYRHGAWASFGNAYANFYTGPEVNKPTRAIAVEAFTAGVDWIASLMASDSPPKPSTMQGKTEAVAFTRSPTRTGKRGT